MNAESLARGAALCAIFAVCVAGPARKAWASGDGLAADGRLSVHVSARASGESLESVLAGLPGKAGVSLRADAGLRDRRITIFCKAAPLRSVMRSVAAVTRATWRATAPGGDYELYQTDDQRRDERRLVAVSERRDEHDRTAKDDALLKAVRSALSARGADRQPIADLLAGLTPEELDTAADVANEPTGVIGTSNGQLLGHLLYVAPLANLSDGAQGAIHSMYAGPAFDRGSAAQRLARPSDIGIDPARAQVGLVAADGGLRIGIVGADGSIWVSPLAAVRRHGIPGVDSDSDMPSEVVEALNRGTLVDLTGLPASAARATLTFPPDVDRLDLHALLRRVSEQAGVPVVADDFLRNARATFPWLLTDRDSFTLRQALDEIARAFGRRIAYREGVLRATTVSPGLDIRSEPPPSLVARLEKLHRERRALTLKDYLDLAALSNAQYQALLSCRSPAVRRLPFIAVQQLRPVLRFYASLRPEQRAQAESAGGLPAARLDMRQGPDFSALLIRGIPRARQEGDIRRPGFYVERKPAGDAETLTFTAIARDGTGVRTYALTVRQPNPPPTDRTAPISH